MKTIFLCRLAGLLLLSITACFQANAQNCGPANAIYGDNSDQRTLVSIDTATGTATIIGDLFGGGAAANDPSKATSAMALDPVTGIIWFSTRTPANIYSYKPGAANPYGTTTAAFGFSGTVNKAAYNPADGKIYFHVGQTTNTLYRFDPANPTTAPVAVGSLGLSGSTTTAGNFSGGDIAFDGLGNLTGVLNNLNALAVFPANYDANGNYLGINLGQGVVIANTGTAPASVAFLPSGDYLVGGTSIGVVRVNTNTATQTTLSSLGTADFASCAAPVPNLVVTQTATSSCTAANQITLTFTIKVRNTGRFVAINARIFDEVPAGLTITGATLNGTAIPGANNALFNTGDGPLISSTGAAAFQNGVVERGDSATIVLTATAVPGMYSNQAGVVYTGVQKLNLPNDRVWSDNPATSTVNDATAITGGCSSLAGSVFNDNNGMKDNAVNGSGTGTPGGTQLYINLVNSGGIVIASVAVNANGTYSIPNIPNGNFTAQLSSTQGKAGEAAPVQALPEGWVNTGESFGGVNDVTVGGGLPLTVSGNTSNANFGIERLPESYPVTNNFAGVPVLTNLGNQSLQGSDPEDQNTQGAWTGKTIVIDTLPTNGYLLKYNGVSITAGTPITNYNPALLTIEPTAASAGTGTSTFKYSTIDAAGKKDPTPANYTVNWSIPLPVQLQKFEARLTKDCNIILDWTTGREERLKYFGVQHSYDGVHFENIAYQLPKGSNSVYRHMEKAVANTLHYYRLSIVDQDKKITYSPVVSIRNNCSTALKIYPNPAVDKITIEGLTGPVNLKIVNLQGKTIMQEMLEANTRQELDVATLAPGAYYFIFSTSDNVQSIKVLKRN